MKALSTFKAKTAEQSFPGPIIQAVKKFIVYTLIAFFCAGSLLLIKSILSDSLSDTDVNILFTLLILALTLGFSTPATYVYNNWKHDNGKEILIAIVASVSVVTAFVFAATSIGWLWDILPLSYKSDADEMLWQTVYGSFVISLGTSFATLVSLQSSISKAESIVQRATIACALAASLPLGMTLYFAPQHFWDGTDNELLSKFSLVFTILAILGVIVWSLLHLLSKRNGTAQPGSSDSL